MLKVGEDFGRYVIEGELGRGGMGRVCRARDAHQRSERRAVHRLRRVLGAHAVVDLKRLERDTGFEPATSSLGSWHSTN